MRPEQLTYPQQLVKSKRIIRQAFLSGRRMTTSEGNRLAQTVDFRKIVSRLRKEGFPIQDIWMESNGHRYKVYFLTNRLTENN